MVEFVIESSTIVHTHAPRENEVAVYIYYQIGYQREMQHAACRMICILFTYMYSSLSCNNKVVYIRTISSTFGNLIIDL